MNTHRHFVSKDWYLTARVRSGARPSSVRGGEGTYFARELQPQVGHALVQRMGAEVENELLRRALIRYLHATDVLELRVVNEVAGEIAQGRWDFETSAQARVEARKLYCDEGYHAVLAGELLAQVGADGGDQTAPAFLDRLTALQATHARSDAEARLIRFLFTVVTETAITQTLVNLTRNPTVLPAVRELAAEHARDEARHSGFFSGLFAACWQWLAPSERVRFGELLPQLVHCFLVPDVEAVDADLRRVGVSAADRAQVLGETFCGTSSQQAVRRDARPVLGCFRRGGALGIQGHPSPVAEAFAAAGLMGAT